MTWFETTSKASFIESCHTDFAADMLSWKLYGTRIKPMADLIQRMLNMHMYVGAADAKYDTFNP